MKILFHEVYGPVSAGLMTAITRNNVTSSDWDMMLMRWGFTWGDANLPFDDIQRHIETHSQQGYYQYPMYVDEEDLNVVLFDEEGDSYGVYATESDALTSDVAVTLVNPYTVPTFARVNNGNDPDN